MDLVIQYYFICVPHFLILGKTWVGLRIVMKNLIIVVKFLVLMFFASKAYSDIGSDFFAGIPDNSWARVPTQNNPRKEGHAGMTIDNEHGFLYIFGSDTHNDKTPDNSVHILDLSTLQWTQSYTPDPLSTYLQQSDNWTITSNERPWASHAFYNIVFLPKLNALFVHTAPTHNYTGISAAVATNITEQSWLYFPESSQWKPLKDSNPPNVWAQGISYNPKLNRVIGHDKSSSHRETYLFNPQSLIWETVKSSGSHPAGIEAGAGFNPVSGKSFRFAGNYTPNNQLTEYDPVKNTWEEVLTTGKVPPNGAGPSIAVDPINNVLIYHSVDKSEHFRTNSEGLADTWVLDLNTNHWKNMQPTVRPPNYAFNFTMTFSEKHNVALYYTIVAEPGKPSWTGKPELWAYRYKKDKGVSVGTTATFSEGQLYIPLANVNGDYYSASSDLINNGDGKFIFQLINAQLRKDLESTDASLLNNISIIEGDRLKIPLVNVLGVNYSAEMKILLEKQNLKLELIDAQPLKQRDRL